MRYFASALIGAVAILLSSSSRADSGATSPAGVSECLAMVREIHGAAGPWAVVGYRIGQRALAELKLPRQSFSLLVIHRAPAKVQFSCIADGLQAATGASVGKLNLRFEEVPVDKLCSIIEDRKTGRRLIFTLQPSLLKSITDLPHDQLEAQGRRVAEMPDDQIFRVTENNSQEK